MAKEITALSSVKERDGTTAERDALTAQVDAGDRGYFTAQYAQRGTQANA